MDMHTLGLLVGGLVVLVIGAELLVRGASRLAAAFGVPALIIGLTIVAFGTSAPEMAVSAKSAAIGQSDIAVGNVVGSNIFNVLFILGASALIVPLSVHRQLLRIDVPIMVAASVLIYPIAWGGLVSRVEGVVLLSLLAGYTLLQIVLARRQPDAAADEFDKEFGKPAPRTIGSVLLYLALIAGGLALLVFGARWLVDGAVTLARHFGVSELVIGLTIIAAGTSLPEVATSITAAVKGERDIAVGNVVGSCIFNLLGVLGLAAVISPVAVADQALRLDLPIMIAVAVACLPVFFTGRSIARWEGGVFLGYYIAYTSYMILEARGNHLADPLGFALVGVALPLTAITLAVLFIRAKRNGEGGSITG